VADERLREREHEWKRGGAAGEEAAWLAHRIRAGELEIERVRLAALLGDPAAVGAVGPVTPSRPWPWDYAARVLIAAGRACWPVEETPWRQEALALEAAEYWILDPVPGRAVLLQEAVQRVHPDEEPRALVGLIQALGETARLRSTQQLHRVVAHFGKELLGDILPWARGIEDPLERRAAERRERALTAWRARQGRLCGRLLYEGFTRPQRVAWATRLLDLVLRQGEPPPAEVERVARLADEPDRWREGHDAFQDVRRLTLEAERAPASPRSRGYTETLLLAENVAKVIYNASGEPAPFDFHCGWLLPAHLLVLKDELEAPDFADEAEQCLFSAFAGQDRRAGL